jgi:hypothetical protein
MVLLRSNHEKQCLKVLKYEPRYVNQANGDVDGNYDDERAVSVLGGQRRTGIVLLKGAWQDVVGDDQ